MTEYIVLRKETRAVATLAVAGEQETQAEQAEDSGPPPEITGPHEPFEAWVVVPGATSLRQAVEEHGEGEYATVPARSWKPKRYKPDTSVRIVGA